jgi:hypothetical protein
MFVENQTHLILISSNSIYKTWGAELLFSGTFTWSIRHITYYNDRRPAVKSFKKDKFMLDKYNQIFAVTAKRCYPYRTS